MPFLCTLTFCQVELEKIQGELKQLTTFRKSNKKWQVSMLAALCVGLPLFVGYYFENLPFGLIASLSGLVILYLPDSGSVTNRIITLLISAFGFMASYAFGLLFSFSNWGSAVALGIFTFVVHTIILYYKVSPPRSFFFVLFAAMALCQPFDLSLLPVKIGLVGLGALFTCFVAIGYTLFLSIKSKIPITREVKSILEKNVYGNFWEAIIMGVFMFLALFTGQLLELDKPYWIPISTAAVMQGASQYQIWQRTFHRILGTFLGLGLTYLLLMYIKAPLAICFTIMSLQFIIELLIVRQYAFAVVFITPMTIFLADASNPLFSNPSELISLRFIEIVLGSILGAIGGWLLHKEKIRFATVKGIQKMGEGFLKP